MKRLSMKNKVFLLLSILVCSVFMCSIFSSFRTQETHFAEAATEYYSDGDFIINLKNGRDSFGVNSYSLIEHYPLASENQTESKLCWIYSSLKVLESSFMLQKGVYHNFSEMGMAYLYYRNITLNSDTEAGSKKIDVTGNFANFNILAQNYGLIYENSFSNDLYFDINENNYENYSYVLDYVDTTIMDSVRPINIHDDTEFVKLDRSDKIKVMKEYIMNYGGIFAGLEQGIISSQDSIYKQTNDTSYAPNDGSIPSSHAVCIVGWNETKSSFIALNSWGVSEKSYSTFFIPYNYAELYNDIYGYICVGDPDARLTQKSSSAGGDDGFTTTVNQRFEEMNNLFIYNEEIEYEFQISGVSKFDNVFVKVLSGTSNITENFSIEFMDSEQKILISCNDESLLSSGYLIKFTDGDTLIGYKDFYVFTGTELSYVELKRESAEEILDSTLFNNTLASGKDSETYYVSNSENSDYFLRLYFSGINDITKRYYEVSEIGTYMVSTENGYSATPTTDATAVLDTKGNINSCYKFNISDLCKNNNYKVILITITLKSKITEYSKTYNFYFIISSFRGQEKEDVTETEDSSRIVYELDGGKNSSHNIDRFPDFTKEKDREAFSYTLSNPSKFSSTFTGWYLDKDYQIEITSIDYSIYEKLGITNPDGVGRCDIVIYARWENEDVNYFDLDLRIDKVTDYYNQQRSYNGEPIIYGDSVDILFTFTPAFDKLTTYRYFSKYEYKFCGTTVSSDNELSESGESITFSNLFHENHLVCGQYSVKVNVLMVISHQFSVSKDIELTYEVTPKSDVAVQFDPDTLVYTYNKQPHLPEVSFSGIYEEDMGDLQYQFNMEPVVNAGTYNYSVKSISNPNYAISDGNSAQLVINKAPLRVSFSNTEQTYNGTSLSPSYELEGVVEGDYITFDFTDTDMGTKLNMKDAGEYKVSARNLNSENYQFEGSTDCIFTINKTPITFSFETISIRFTIAEANRPQITIKYDPKELFDPLESLGIDAYSEGETAKKSGRYPIVGLFEANEVNKNYDIIFIEGDYVILGEYTVFYTLPNGKSYTETVNDGENPVGIPEDVYKLPLFSKFKYDVPLEGNGLTDLYVTVTVESYAWIVWFTLVIVVFVVVYLIVSRKSRKNKTR